MMSFREKREISKGFPVLAILETKSGMPMLEIYDDCRGISNGTVLRKFCYGISEVCACIA